MIDAVVTGQSLPALQTAIDLAEVGLKVAILEDRDGESLAPALERDPEGTIAALIRRIAEPIEHSEQQPGRPDASDAAVVTVLPTPPFLRRDGAWLPQSAVETLGIPAVPLASENIALLGMGGALRAFLDRVTPLLTVGKTRLLGDLVRKRMGAQVRDRLVDPQVFARFGVESGQVDAAIAAPGLNEALSRSGALSSAVLAYSDRNVARETRVAPARGTVEFRNSILHRLELYGVQVHQSRLSRVASTPDGWELELADGSAMAARSLVVDFGEHPVPDPAVADVVSEVAPATARVHAVTDMNRPEWLPMGATAVALVDDRAVVISDVTSQEPGELAGESGRVRAEVRISSRVKRIAELDPSGAGARPGELPVSLASLDLPVGDIAPLRSSGIAAAPYPTVEARDIAAENLAQLERQVQTLLPVGRAIHGDDQGAALAAAHVSAVQLRRRLLGLE